jgi:hypothetical protein
MTHPLKKRLAALEANRPADGGFVVGFAGMYDQTAPLEPRRFATFAVLSAYTIRKQEASR